MKQTFKTATVVIAVLLAAMSCTKEIEAPRASEGSLNISIQGGINDLTPAAEVKATAGTVIRANWEEGDTVYVYGGSEYLGALKVSLKDGDARYAYLSNEGSISSPDPGTTKLTLVYASNVTQAPAVIDGQIKIDLSNQDGADFPFVLYGTLDYTDGQGTIADKFVPFEFATSVVKINCTGLDADVPVSKAELTNVNTECVLTLSKDAAATVSAGKLDTLSRTGNSAFSIADGKAVFQIAVVNTDEATTQETARDIILTQGKKEFISDFSTAALQSGKSYNTICEFRKYQRININDILCFEALEANSTVSMSLSLFAVPTETPRYPNLVYSTNGKNWDDFIVDRTTVLLENVGDKVWICGDNPNGLSYYDDQEGIELYSFVMKGKISASGNVMSLIDKYCDVDMIPPAYVFMTLFSGCESLVSAPDLPAKNLTAGCYTGMFNSCSSLVSAPELPAEKLAQACYQNMFSGCESLLNAPELPAKILADNCYEGMFNGCNSLVTAPELPAEILKTSCYEEMFAGCKSLVSAPELPAEILADNCYDSMFAGCKSLKESPKLPAKKLAKECYCYMFERCESLSSITMLATDISAMGCLDHWVDGVSETGTFTKSADMNALPTGVSGIPEGWTVKNYGEDEEVPEGALPGVFSVSDTRKVHFSQGNLWHGPAEEGADATFNFETNQYSGTSYANNHVSHFYWSKDASVAYAEGYNDGSASGSDVFFTNETETTSKDGFTVNVGGTEQTGWRTLSTAEWTYLFNNHTKKWATVNGVNGYVIAPDGFEGTLADSYADDAALAAAGNLVFLPAAGYRPGSNVISVGGEGNYWSSTAYDEDVAFNVRFSSSRVRPDYFDYRNCGFSVRLITECQ